MLGSSGLDLAEDAVQSAILKALETWRFGEVPENPSGWLFRVAKNRALDLVRREETRKRLEPEVIERSTAISQEIPGAEISDSLLRMILVCCSPDIPEASRIALTLKILCGFSTREIADALLATKESVHKRIQRAKQSFRRSDLEQILVEKDLEERIRSVNRIVYLVFNEGYASTHSDEHVRRDLCGEAIRLNKILLGCPGRKGGTLALQALMYLQAARLDTRTGDCGEIILLEDQDRSRWDANMIREGLKCLESSVTWEGITTYHIEASIAAHHCISPSMGDTDWIGESGPHCQDQFEANLRWIAFLCSIGISFLR
jgi:RNA polymerase sigma-70 factor (ECF subfamily)